MRLLTEARLGPRAFSMSVLVSRRAFGLYEGPGILSPEQRPLSISDIY